MDEGTRSGKTQHVIIVFLLGLLVGGVIVWFVVGRQVAAPTVDDVEQLSGNFFENPGSNTNFLTRNSTSSDEYIVVQDQLAGDRILLQEVRISKSGWVVVHEVIGNTLGNALGARRFDPGTYEEEYVELLRNTETDALYQAILYHDNGDRIFSLETDEPYRKENGVFIGDSFRTIFIDRKIE